MVRMSQLSTLSLVPGLHGSVKRLEHCRDVRLTGRWLGSRTGGNAEQHDDRDSADPVRVCHGMSQSITGARVAVRFARRKPIEVDTKGCTAGCDHDSAGRGGTARLETV
jgi:hypothetical protein